MGDKAEDGQNSGQVVHAPESAELATGDVKLEVRSLGGQLVVGKTALEVRGLTLRLLEAEARRILQIEFIFQVKFLHGARELQPEESLEKLAQGDEGVLQLMLVVDDKLQLSAVDRRVRALLNKFCPENRGAIIESLAQVDLRKAEELNHVVRIIFSKALAEPHYSDTYFDMMVTLGSRYTAFPPEHEGEKPQTFIRMLLNMCQEEFWSLLDSFKPTDGETQPYSAEELQLDISKRKQNILVIVNLIGKLYLCSALATKVVAEVVNDLIGNRDEYPEEHMIECVCELIQATGYSLDKNLHGKRMLSICTHRLRELKNATDPLTDAPVFSNRIRVRLQDTIAMVSRIEGQRD